MPRNVLERAETRAAVYCIGQSKSCGRGISPYYAVQDKFIVWKIGSCSAVKLALKFALKIVHIMFDASQVSDFSLDLAQLAVKFFL
jgi:hypothetical protein